MRKLGSLLIIVAAIWAPLAISDETAPATPSQLPSAEPVAGLYISPTIGMDVTTYSSNFVGGIGFGSQILAQYFLTPTVGLYGGFGPAIKPITLNSSSSVLFIDVPFGLCFQYSMNKSNRNLIGLGINFAIPTGNFPDSGGTQNLRTYLNLDLQLATYFPITENFELGLGGVIRYGFSTPFAVLSTGYSFGAQIGLTGRVRL